MEPLFGPIVQNAYVVDDLDAAMNHWLTTMHIGPFFVFQHIQFKEIQFRGAPTSLDMTAAIAYWGDMQIELIYQHNEAPSIYTEFKSKGLRGLQHIGVYTSDLDAHLAKLAPLGITPTQSGTVSTGARFAYVSTDFHPGGMVELIETHEMMLSYFEYMKKTAREWTGDKPIRRF